MALTLVVKKSMAKSFVKGSTTISLGWDVTELYLIFLIYYKMIFNLDAFRSFVEFGVHRLVSSLDLFVYLYVNLNLSHGDE